MEEYICRLLKRDMLRLLSSIVGKQGSCET